MSYNISRPHEFNLDFFTKNEYYITIMKTPPRKLTGNLYFDTEGLPVALKRVEGCSQTHLHDFTGQCHFHDFVEIVIIEDGLGVQDINGELYPLKAGDIFVIQHQTRHYFTDYANLKIINIMFDPALLKHAECFLRRIPGFNTIFMIEPRLRKEHNFRNHLYLNRPQIHSLQELLAKMDRELKDRPAGHEAAVPALLLEIVIYLSRNFQEKEHRNVAPLRLGKLLSLLEHKYNEDWTLARMAELCFMSVNNLLRLFRMVTGTSPVAYLLRLRLEQSRKMLMESDLSISEIADRCGFHDSNYYSKKFTGCYGHSPRKYRKTVEIP